MERHDIRMITNAWAKYYKDSIRGSWMPVIGTWQYPKGWMESTDKLHVDGNFINPAPLVIVVNSRIRDIDLDVTIEYKTAKFKEFERYIAGNQARIMPVYEHNADKTATFTIPRFMDTETIFRILPDDNLVYDITSIKVNESVDTLLSGEIVPEEGLKFLVFTPKKYDKFSFSFKPGIEDGTTLYMVAEYADREAPSILKISRTMENKLVINSKEYVNIIIADNTYYDCVVDRIDWTNKKYRIAINGNIFNDVSFRDNYVESIGAFGIQNDINLDHYVKNIMGYMIGVRGDEVFTIFALASPTSRLIYAQNWHVLYETSVNIKRSIWSCQTPCATCQGTGFVNSVICPECDGYKFSGTNATSHLLDQLGGDVGIVRTSLEDDEKFSRRVWSRKWWVIPTKSEIERYFRHFLHITADEGISIVERFDSQEPTFFIAVDSTFIGSKSVWQADDPFQNFSEMVDRITPAGVNAFFSWLMAWIENGDGEGALDFIDGSSTHLWSLNSDFYGNMFWGSKFFEALFFEQSDWSSENLLGFSGAMTEDFEMCPLGTIPPGLAPNGNGSWIYFRAIGDVLAGKHAHFQTSSPIWGYVVYDFTAKKPTAAGDYAEIKFFAGQGNKDLSVALQKDVPGTYWDNGFFMFWSDSKIYAWDQNLYFVFLQNYTPLTWYWVRIVMVDSTHYDVMVSTDGLVYTTYDRGGLHFLTAGTLDILSNLQLDFWNNDIYYARVDDIRLSWQTDKSSIVKQSSGVVYGYFPVISGTSFNNYQVKFAATVPGTGSYPLVTCLTENGKTSWSDRRIWVQFKNDASHTVEIRATYAGTPVDTGLKWIPGSKETWIISTVSPGIFRLGKVNSPGYVDWSSNLSCMNAWTAGIKYIQFESDDNVTGSLIDYVSYSW